MCTRIKNKLKTFYVPRSFVEASRTSAPRRKSKTKERCSRARTTGAQPTSQNQPHTQRKIGARTSSRRQCPARGPDSHTARKNMEKAPKVPYSRSYIHHCKNMRGACRCPCLHHAHSEFRWCTYIKIRTYTYARIVRTYGRWRHVEETTCQRRARA